MSAPGRVKVQQSSCRSADEQIEAAMDWCGDATPVITFFLFIAAVMSVAYAVWIVMFLLSPGTIAWR